MKNSVHALDIPNHLAAMQGTAWIPLNFAMRPGREASSSGFSTGSATATATWWIASDWLMVSFSTHALASDSGSSFSV